MPECIDVWQAFLYRDAPAAIWFLTLHPDFFQTWNKRPTWETDPLGNSFGAGGLFLTLSELHKFGLFYLNKGKWNGKQILSEKWIEESTKAADVGYYGYLFWRGEYNSFRADGKYSQISMILPQKNAVVSFVSECRREGELLKTVYELVCAKL